MTAPARLFTPTAATLAGASVPALLQEPCVERHPAHVGRRHPVDERRCELGQHGRAERDMAGHRADQRHRAGHVGQRGQADDHRQPGPVRAAAAHASCCSPGRSAEAGSRRRRPARQSPAASAAAPAAAGRGPVSASSPLAAIAAARVRFSSPSWPLIRAGCWPRGRAAAAAAPRRRRRRAPIAGSAAGDRTVRADPARQRGEQLGHVDRPLAAGRGELGEAEVDQPGAPVLADHDVAAVQRPVRDPGLVQAAHLEPQVTGELVGDAARPGSRPAAGQLSAPWSAALTRRRP